MSRLFAAARKALATLMNRVEATPQNVQLAVSTTVSLAEAVRKVADQVSDAMTLVIESLTLRPTIINITRKAA